MFYANGGTTKVLGSSFETAPGLPTAGSETTLVVLGMVCKVEHARHKTVRSRVVAVSMRAAPITPRYKVFREIVSARSRHQVLCQLPDHSTKSASAAPQKTLPLSRMRCAAGGARG